MDSSFEKSLAVVAVFGGLGAFIDFYIGPNNQKRVRDWLETWLEKFSDVRLGNFGRREALFAVGVMDRLLGRRLVSLQRMYASLSAVGIAVVIAAVFSVDDAPWFGKYSSHYILALLCSIAMFAFSVTLTRAVSMRVSSLMGASQALNFGGFIFIVLIQYAIMCSWPQVTQSVIGFVTTYSLTKITQEIWLYQLELWTLIFIGPISHPSNPIAFFTQQLYIYTTNFGTEYGQTLFEARISNTLGLLPNLGRLLLGLIFVGSFFLRPVLNFFLTLWLRVVQSDKPIFTLVFGGIAGFAEAIDQVGKILLGH